jgi:UDPglucose 6-dehydrogenase
MSNITVIGTGYVGLVTGACLSDFGLSVTCYDVDREKIGRLNKGEIPIFEEGLEPIVRKNSGNGRLTFSCDLARAVTSASVIFLAVGTPSLPDGSADLSYLEQALRDLAGHLDGYQVIVSKSTVPIGTTRRIRERLAAFCREAGRDASFDVIANPEFLREGSAVYDFMHPDRVILGFDAPRALAGIQFYFYPDMSAASQMVHNLLIGLSTEDEFRFTVFCSDHYPQIGALFVAHSIELKSFY